MRLDARIITRAALHRRDTQRMFRLMTSHYDGVRYGDFLRDLDGKDLVVLLEKDRVIRGFSTLALFDHELEGVRVRVAFSGDTIVDRRSWGSWALPIAWAGLMREVAASAYPRPLYWFLISKGYKTYRFLPVFFREYVPQPDTMPSSFDVRLLRSLGLRKYPGRFDPGRGVILAGTDSQRLKPGIAEITAERRRDPNIAFFERMNPGHAAGDELACIARFEDANLVPFIRRRLGEMS